MATFSPLTLVRQLLAELVGTFFLTTVAGIVVLAYFGNVAGYQSLYVPAAVGGLILVLVYLLGPVSGAHLNPAVSLALFVFRKISSTQLVGYLVAQVIGAWLGSRFIIELVGVAASKPSFVDTSAMLGEFIGTLLLVFAVMTVVLGRVHESMSGVVVGGALTVALSIAMVTRAGVLNPAVAFGFGATNATYLLIPFLGGLAGAALAVFFDPKSKP